MQRRAQDFLANKKRRTEMLAKMWVQVEDNFLSNYFRTYATQIMREEKVRREKDAEKRGAVKNKAATRTSKLTGEGVGAIHAASTSWKSLRIPVSKRKAAIGQFYMKRLRDYVRSCSSWVNFFK
jgi:hypothetical protein